MSTAQQQEPQNRESIFDSIFAVEPVSPNHLWLAKIIASWMVGETALPDNVGLSEEQFKQMCSHFFPNANIPTNALSGITADYSRMPEKEDLITLLKTDAREDKETDWIVGLIVSACLGSDHLWQDLGVWQRPELTALMRYNFPVLAERNNKDMKWKKFLYKQMCEAEGIYVCRAPSCEVCADYANCFNTEDSEH